jgi:nucleoside triphosphatase
MKKEYPEPVVGAFIFNDGGEVLLVKSPKWDVEYTIPGGHIELGETIEKYLETVKDK